MRADKDIRRLGGGPAVPRPRLALRIGITGARALRADRIAAVRGRLHDILSLVRTTAAQSAAESRIRASYEGGEAETGAAAQAGAWLRFLSPLARGSDRLAADVAVSLGYDLFVPMPFARGEYEKDFAGAQNPSEPALSAAADQAEFAALLSRAGDNVLSLDGARVEQDRAYEAVGRFVVRHSDVLIAVWDGGPSGGRGGTAEIVDYAAQRGVPVLWIHATEDRDSVWIAGSADLRDPSPSAGDPMKPLRAYVENLIAPPPAAAHHAHGLVEKLARLGQGRRLDPLQDYGLRGAKPPGAWARAYDLMMRWAARIAPSSTSQPVAAPDRGTAHYWAERYQPADLRTGHYAARYRSAYVWLFVFATATLVFGASAAVAHGHFGAVVTAVCLEALMLIAILSTVVAAIRGDWHERFIEFRLLAELCRKQQVLGGLGRSVSFSAIDRIVQESAHESAHETSETHAAPARDRKAWVTWLFAAWERAAPLPVGHVASGLDELVRTHVLAGLIDTQLAYHRQRAERSVRADETFFKFGQWCFIAVCVCVALKLFVLFGVHMGAPETHGAEDTGWREVLGEIAVLALTWLAIVLPAVSAAAFGIRSYAELQLLTEQSRHMIKALETAKRRIESIDLTRPLAVENVAAETQAVATLMLQDIDGWSRLFKLKAIEP